MENIVNKEVNLTLEDTRKTVRVVINPGQWVLEVLRARDIANRTVTPGQLAKRDLLTYGERILEARDAKLEPLTVDGLNTFFYNHKLKEAIFECCMGDNVSVDEIKRITHITRTYTNHIIESDEIPQEIVDLYEGVLVEIFENKLKFAESFRSRIISVERIAKFKPIKKKGETNEQEEVNYEF